MPGSLKEVGQGRSDRVESCVNDRFTAVYITGEFKCSSTWQTQVLLLDASHGIYKALDPSGHGCSVFRETSSCVSIRTIQVYLRDS